MKVNIIMPTRKILHLFLFLLTLSGCSAMASVNQPTNFVSPLPEPSTTDADMVAIYTALLQNLMGQGDSWPKVYMIQKTDDRIANPGTAVESPSIELSASVQNQISANLSGLATTVIWVGSWHEVDVDKNTGMVIGGGAIITLGNINRIDVTHVHVPAGVYYASLGAEGGTYVIEKQAEQWQVTGMTGPQWIS